MVKVDDNVYSIQYDKRYDSYLTKYKTSSGKIIKGQFTKIYHGHFALALAKHFRDTGIKLTQWFITDGETTAVYPIKDGKYHRVLMEKRTHDIYRLNFISIRKKENGYNVAYIIVNGKQKSLHRIIMNTPDHLTVDHRNRDSLDNRRVNLRNVTTEINNRNKKPRINNISGHHNIEIHGPSYRVVVSDLNGGCVRKTFSHDKYDDPLSEAIKFRDSYIDKYYGR